MTVANGRRATVATADCRRDLISFPVFNPLTIGRMVRGAQRLGDLAATTDRSTETVMVDGAEIKRVLLRSGRKRYKAHAELYLRERIVNRLAAHGGDDLDAVLSEVLAAPAQGMYSDRWVDVAGLLLPQTRLNDLLERICAGTIVDLDQLHDELAACAERYADDEWIWVRRQTHKLLGLDLDQPDRAALLKLIDDYGTAQQKFLQLILIDAEREYDEASRIGYGLDGDEAGNGPRFCRCSWRILRQQLCSGCAGGYRIVSCSRNVCAG